MENLRPCPMCKGEIELMGDPFRIKQTCACYARCQKCRKRYDLPKI